MKKCQHCGTISQDEDFACGICGTNIANTPTIKGSIEDEILRDRKEAERESTLLKGMFAKASKRRLVKQLLISISAVSIGSATVIYLIAQALSLLQLYDATTIPAYYNAFIVDIIALFGVFAATLVGLNLGIKGATLGSPGLISQGPGGTSNLSMRATYEGQFVPKEQQNPDKPSH